MRVFSYVVAKDGGFAPNPFHGFCTLACCKPRIRATADVGDLVIGLTKRSERLVYMMLVSEVLEFDDYWADPRFEVKKPNRSGRVAAQLVGDNIYEPDGEGEFRQLPSSHSDPDGTERPEMKRRDLSSRRVLVGTEFVYFGGDGPPVPGELMFVKVNRGHRCRFSDAEVRKLREWFEDLPRGQLGTPGMWRRKVHGERESGCDRWELPRACLTSLRR